MTWLAAGGLALGAAGTGFSIYQQEKARRAANKARRKQALQDAYMQLAQAAGGYQPQMSQVPAPAPEVDYGGAISQIGGAVSQFGAAQNAATAAKQAKADALALEAAKFGVTPGANTAATTAAIAQAKQQQDYRQLAMQAAQSGASTSAPSGGPMREEDIIAELARQQAAKDAAATATTQKELAIKEAQAGIGDSPAAKAQLAKIAADTKRAEAMGTAATARTDIAKARLDLEKAGGPIKSRIEQANRNMRASISVSDMEGAAAWKQYIEELEAVQDAAASGGAPSSPQQPLTILGTSVTPLSRL